MEQAGLINFDESKFHPKEPLLLRHCLINHPLFQLSSLVKLAKRITPPGDVRWFCARATPGSEFRALNETHGTGASLEETLDHIDVPGSWVGLHYIQGDPEYRGLIDELFDAIQPLVERHDPGMCQRTGFIFISAPGAVTPYHLDPDNGILLQIRGAKRVYSWDPRDRQVVSELALEEFFAGLPVNERRYREEYQQKALTFELAPGTGLYLPWTGPHWVEVGATDYSISFNVSYRTRATERTRVLHEANHALRQRGINIGPLGQSAVIDASKYWAYSTMKHARQLIKR